MPPQSAIMDQNTNLLTDANCNGPTVSHIANGHSSNTNGNATNTNESKPVDKVKCVLVGDGAVGKTSLIVSYTTNGYPTEYMPTAFDDYSVLVTVDSTPVQMQLCDTAGQDDFDAIRPLCYPNTDVFLLCFSVVSPTSFNNIVEKWVPEIRRHCLKCPMVLVGTQCDLRNDVKVLIELAKYDEKPVPEEDALKLSQNIGAAYYLECSALTQKNLKDVFDHAILASLNYNSCGGDLSRGKPLRKSSRKKYNLTAPNASGGHCGGGSTLKKAGWKKFCCFL